MATYARRDYRYSYLLTKDGAEIDLIIDRPGKPTALVEIKSKTQIDSRDLRNLKHFQSDFANPMLMVLSNDATEKIIDGVECCHWRYGIEKLIFS